MFFKKTFQTRTCILLSTLIFLPYFFNVFYKGGIGLLNHLIMFLGVGFAGVVFYIAQRKKIYKERQLPFYENFFLIALVAAFSVSYLTSQTGNTGLLELGGIYAGAILIILGYHIASDKDRLTDLFSFLTLSGLLSIVVGFSVYFGGAFDRFAGTFNNFFEPWSAFPNAFGDFLLLILPLTFHLCETQKKKNSNALFYIPELTFTLGVAAIFLTDSQGLYIAGLILFALLLIRLTVTGQFAKKFILLTLVGLVIGYGALSFKSGMMSDYRESVRIEGEIADGKSFENSHSFDTRIDHFKTAFNLMMEAPIFGYGPGSYPYVSASKVSLLNNEEHPHNVFLKIGVENGIITMVAFIGLIGIILFRSLLMFFQKLDPAREVVFLSIVAFLSHQMIDYNLGFASVEFVFFVLLGTLIIERIRKSKRLHIAEMRFINHFMLLTFGIVLVLFSINDLIYNGLAQRSESDGEYFSYKEHTILKRSFYEDLAFYLQSQNMSNAQVVNKGLSANKYNDQLYALSGNFQKAYELNPHDLNNLLGLYENASPAHKAAIKDEVKSVLNEYLFLLSTNASFTVLSDNPIISLSLARLIGDTSLARDTEQTIIREREKFGRLYNLSFEDNGF